MIYKSLGESEKRVDAFAKVTGKAKYSSDYFESDLLIGKVLEVHMLMP